MYFIEWYMCACVSFCLRTMFQRSLYRGTLPERLSKSIIYIGIYIYTQKAVSPNSGYDDDRKLVKRIHIVIHDTFIVTVHWLYYTHIRIVYTYHYCRDRITKYAIRYTAPLWLSITQQHSRRGYIN